MPLEIMTRKKAMAYVPWVALGSSIIVFVGMIVWATGANKALPNTDKALQALGQEIEGTINTVHSATVGAVVVCVIMSCVMVLMSGGRTCLEKAVDQHGKAVCGSWLWLAVTSILCTIWWIILFWLVFVIFGSCLWYGAAHVTVGVLTTTINEANNYAAANAAAIAAINATIATSNITNNGTAPVPASAAVPVPSPSSLTKNMTSNSTCGDGCLNLAMFDFLVNQFCTCDVAAMNTALNYTNKAYDALPSVVAGAFLLWVGASFLLMSAVADFAKTKRERELLLRAQRAAIEGAAAQLALGTANGYAPYATHADNLPLLQAQALQQQQLQQHQLAMQMQMMAQAQKPGGMPGAGGVPRSGPGSSVNLHMGSQV